MAYHPGKAQVPSNRHQVGYRSWQKSGFQNWDISFPGGSEGKEPTCNAKDLGSAPGSERSSVEGDGNPFQYSCLESSTVRGAQRATVHKVTVRHNKLLIRTIKAGKASFVVVVQLLSWAQLFVTPQTVAHQAPLSLEFSREEYWSGSPFPSLGDLPDPGIEPRSPALAGGFFTTGSLGKPKGILRL